MLLPLGSSRLVHTLSAIGHSLSSYNSGQSAALHIFRGILDQSLWFHASPLDSHNFWQHPYLATGLHALPIIPHNLIVLIDQVLIKLEVFY